MLKPYNRQQIQTDKMLSSIGDVYYRTILEQILTHKDTLYNITPNTKSFTLLRNMITNTDSVIILVYDTVEPTILDEHGGYNLGTLAWVYVGTKYYTISSAVQYIIETNYKSVQDVYTRLPCIHLT